MSKKLFKKMVNLIASTLYLTMVLLFLYFCNYIDSRSIIEIYLPIWFIGIVTGMLGLGLFANSIIVFAGVGLITEYVIHLYNKPYANMSGAFINTLILFIGFLTGIVLQIWKTLRKKNNMFAK